MNLDKEVFSLWPRLCLGEFQLLLFYFNRSIVQTSGYTRHGSNQHVQSVGGLLELLHQAA